MHVCAVIPNDEWRNTAGVRIRYERMRPALAERGIQFDLISIDKMLQEANPTADFYLLCKCHDARSVGLVQNLKARDCRIGVDVFDDYYSDADDSSFVHLRRWFCDMTPLVDFFLCATPVMKDRLQSLAPRVPCHVMNDPAGPWDEAHLAQVLERKRERFLQRKVVEIGWFGIGDNPYFQLGLDDLSAYGAHLLQCRAAGLDARLQVLTNRRALTTDRLHTLMQLPVPVEVEEWNEEREAALIEEALFCFLPVNGQPFSSAKSLNRAVSVLTGGSQVLAQGFPLYNALSPFIYREAADILRDAQSDQLKMRQETLAAFARHMSELGDAMVEAKALFQFLSALPAPRKQTLEKGRVRLLVQGQKSVSAIENQLKATGFLSVAGPYTLDRKRADVRVQKRIGSPGRYGVRVYLSQQAAEKMQRRWQKRIHHGPKGLSVDLPEKELTDLKRRLSAADLSPVSNPMSQLRELERYNRDTEIVFCVLNTLFQTPSILLSEQASPHGAGQLKTT